MCETGLANPKTNYNNLVKVDGTIRPQWQYRWLNLSQFFPCLSPQSSCHAAKIYRRGTVLRSTLRTPVNRMLCGVPRHRVCRPVVTDSCMAWCPRQPYYKSRLEISWLIVHISRTSGWMISHNCRPSVVLRMSAQSRKLPEGRLPTASSSLQSARIFSVKIEQ